MRTRALLLIALSGCVGVPPLAPPKARPNVLFIAVDDLNDWVGCLGGHPQARTPNIDRLASQGTLFTNAHCTAPLCNPSRASVLTGLYPSTSGVHGNQQDWRKSPYLKGRSTLPQTFKERGYWTGASGKIYHANHGGEAAALNGGHGGLQGFNHPASWSERHPSKDRQLSKPAVRPGQNMNGLDIWHWDWGPIDVKDAETTDGKSVAWACERLRNEFDRPFFLAVGIYRPHGPWYVPRRYFDPFDVKNVTLPTLKEDDLDDVPKIATPYLRNPRHLHQQILDHDLYPDAVRAYLANVAFADAMVGRIVKALSEGPNGENTIVCLWSDHGWHLGEKKKWHKSTNWEEATRVPLLIVAPGVTQAGSRSPRAVSLVDLYPTLLELCSLGQVEGLDGESLVPLLKNPTAPRKQPAITTRAGKHHSVRSDEWRYIRYADGSEELYYHPNDPNEWENLAAKPEYQAKKKSLAVWLPIEVRVVPTPEGARGESGFRPILNEYDGTGWEGDPAAWTVRDGTISGLRSGNAPESLLVWRGATLGEFELRLSYRVASGSCKVSYRDDERGDPFLLKPSGDSWNELRISTWKGRRVHRVNGKVVFERAEDPGSDGRLTFSIPHEGPTEIQIRNVRWRNKPRPGKR